MTWADWDYSLMALCMWREARSEGPDGMAAVGHVVWNRHRESGKSVASVITADAQFTSINPPKKTYDSQVDVWPVAPDYRFETAMALAGEILSGKGFDLTNGATFYRNPEIATSAWYQKHIAESPEYVLSAKIGRHEFHAKRPPPPDKPAICGDD